MNRSSFNRDNKLVQSPIIFRSSFLNKLQLIGYSIIPVHIKPIYGLIKYHLKKPFTRNHLQKLHGSRTLTTVIINLLARSASK